MEKELSVNETELLAEISLGLRLQELVGTPGDYQLQMIQENQGAIFTLLNESGVFDGLLEPIDAGGEKTHGETDMTPIARYADAKGEESYVLLATDARPEVVRVALSSLPDELKASRKELVFLGLQDPELDRAKMNAAAKLGEGEGQAFRRVVMPWRYLQFYDILAMSVKTALSHLPIRPIYSSRRRGTSLLVGNGLNQLENNYRSWKDVLKNLVTTNIPHADQPAATDLVTDETIPSPIKFEYLAAHSDDGTVGVSTFSKLKNDIANQMVMGATGMKLPPDNIQNLLRSINPDFLLTTNYDLVLEQCFGVAMRSVSETKYILLPTTYGTGAQPSIYHIHGVAGIGKNSTICIGYEHYMGYVQKIRSRLIKDQRRKESASRIVSLLLGTVPPSQSWEELFFTTDMSIVGLGLSFDETDLWELLTLRAAVLNTSSRLKRIGLSKESYTNTIAYYEVEAPDDPSKDKDKSYDYAIAANRIRRLTAPVMDDGYWLPIASQKGKAKTLKGLGVEVNVVHTVDYRQGYEMILRAIAARP